jgi:hypothetical protein
MSTATRARALAAHAAIATALVIQLGRPILAAELPRDHITLPEAISVDATTSTVVLPLYRGEAHGTAAYYIVTEASRAAVATALHVSFAPNIAGAYAQVGTGRAKSLGFAGAPDFHPARVYTPSATGFPPAAATPGAVGDASYSPFVKLADGTVLNAPIVATGDARDTTTHTDTSDRDLARQEDRVAPARARLFQRLARRLLEHRSLRPGRGRDRTRYIREGPRGIERYGRITDYRNCERSNRGF